MPRKYTLTALVALSLCSAACASSDQEAAQAADKPTPLAAAQSTAAPGAGAADEAEHRKKASLKAADSPAASGAIAKSKAGRRARPAPGLFGRDGDAGRIAQQAPGVRAGEWDDNANYRAFVSYLGSAAHLPYHRLDLRHRRFIVVRDRNGRAVPNCAVTVSDGKTSARLTTTASGRAILFPHAVGLLSSSNQGSLTASTRCQGARAEQRFFVQSKDGVVQLKLDTARALPQRRTVDLAFILDTTGSMSEEIAAVKATIQKVASQLSTSEVNVRVGLVEYKDRSDQTHTRVHQMTSDLQGFSRRIANIRATGGGDHPEDAVAGLRVGLQQLQWSPSSVARMAIMIGDAPPHLDYSQGVDYERHIKRASERGIKVFTIAASGMDALGQAVFRQIAQYTGATNMFVMRGGAGPQSTGGGDPKNACGSTHQNYRSGDLDKLIVAKVKRELKALDGDPMRIAGLGQDERAKPCKQRIN